MKRNLSYLIPKTHCVTFMSTEWRYIMVKLNDFELSVPTERGQLSFSNINFYLKNLKFAMRWKIYIFQNFNALTQP